MLGALFLIWRRRAGTVDVHDVTTASGEFVYWGAVVLTFAMGTALGDFTAVAMKLGYLASAALFAVAIVVPALGYRCGSWIGRVLLGGLHRDPSVGRLARLLAR